MYQIVNPQQTRLFDPFDLVLTGKTANAYRLDHMAKERRTAGRRREQDTDAFRERYKRAVVLKEPTAA